MNPAAILALIGDLYSQVATLTRENAEIRAELAKRPPVDQSREPA